MTFSCQRRALRYRQVTGSRAIIATGSRKEGFVIMCMTPWSQGPLNGGVSNGGVFPIWTCPSFFVLFCPFWNFPDFFGIFPICSGMVRGYSRFVIFLFLSLLRAPTRNSPERVRDTIRTFPEKSGKPPGLENPRFSFSQWSEEHFLTTFDNSVAKPF